MTATLTIDLTAIANNWRLLRDKVSPAECAAVVKANAYGLGVDKIAPALAQAGCRTFFVATLDEGIQLRKTLASSHLIAPPLGGSRRGQAESAGRVVGGKKASVTPPPTESADEDSTPPQGGNGFTIYVFHGVGAGEAQDFMHHRLRPVLNNLGQLENWREATAGPPSPSALHIDTGMNRLGLSPPELERLYEQPEWLKSANIHLVMSHLACADKPEHPLNGEQKERFEKSCTPFIPSPACGGGTGRGHKETCDTPRRREEEMRYSLANSSGIFLGKGYHYDLTRPGYALYGGNPTPVQANPMQPVVSLTAPILSLREIDRGQGVGYGAAFTASETTSVATIATGYADGFLRSGSNRANAYINGRQVPVIGRVSMDLITLNVTHVPEAGIGTEVELLGPHQDVDTLADACGTIGYELLTRSGYRFERRYTEAS